MENQFQIVPLFSSPLVVTIVEEDTDELNNHKDFMYNVYSSDNTNIIDSKGNIKRVLEYYPRIRDILLEKFKKYASEVLKYDNDYMITTSWITNTDNGGFSQQHFHKNSLYSAVYYFQDDYSKASGLELTSPVYQLSDFFITPKEFNEINSKSWTIYPTPKMLIFFPSYVSHQILIHNHNKSRRSLAFNIIPLGSYGEADSYFDYKWIK